MLVTQILTSKASDAVFTALPKTTVSEAVAMLAEKGIGTIIVSSDGGQTADGILSERDIVRRIAKEGAGCLEQPISDLMTADLVTCTRNDEAEQVVQQMTEGRFRHMPVLEDGKLVGLISLGDVVKARLSEISMEKDALQSMIMGH